MIRLLIPFILLITGCSILFVPPYDSTEYNEMITIAAEASHGTCTPTETEHLALMSTHLKYYTQYIPTNDLIYKGVTEMDKTIQELNDQAHPDQIGAFMTKTYCYLKLRVITHMATTLAEAAGKKPR